MCGVVQRTLRIDINSYGIFDMYFVLNMPYGSMCCFATSLKAFFLFPCNFIIRWWVLLDIEGAKWYHTHKVITFY